MKKLQYGIFILSLCLLSSLGWSDTLRLKNGSTIIGRYTGGSEDQINFRVGRNVQQFNVADVISLTFDSYGSRENSDDSGTGTQNGQYQPPPPPPPPQTQDQDRDRDQQQPQPPPPPPQSSDDSDSGYRHFTNRVTVPSGTRIMVRTIDPIDSDKNHVGDRFSATLDEPL